MKRERRPPQTWRRNMVAAAALLVLLDLAIISASPTTTRIALATAVTALVGYAIVRIWRGNVEIERAASGGPKKRQAPSAP